MADNTVSAAATLVRAFRQIVLWPIQLVPLAGHEGLRTHWEMLERPSPTNPWVPLDDEFTSNPEQFQERHYREFVTFLPHVQNFLYGQAPGRQGVIKPGDSPIKIFRRHDTVKARLSATEKNTLTFDIEADMWAQPYPERLYLKTELDIDLASISLSENTGKRT